MLKAALIANAGFTSVCVVVLFLAPDWLGTHIQASLPFFSALGASLAGFVGWLLFLATRSPIPRRLALLTSIGDGLWVVGSVALLVLVPPHFTPTGIALVASVAVVVGACGVAQWRGALLQPLEER